MSDPITATLLFAGVSGGASAGMQILQGKQEQEAAEQQADLERDASLDRENLRLEQYIRAASTQRVGALMAGVDPSSGSQVALERATDTQFRLEQSADDFNTALRVSRLKTAGRNAMIRGIGGAAGTLASSALNLAMFRTGASPIGGKTSGVKIANVPFNR